MIDHSRLVELLDYCPTTGVFTRKVALSNASKVGDILGTPTRGYLEIYVGGQRFFAHRLAWFYVYGSWPIGPIDHIDRNKSNNAISNLREATASQNGANTKRSKASSLKYKGVTAHDDKFKAAITVKRKRIHLGVFVTPEEAAQSYDAAAVTYFGKFAATNRSLNYL